MLATRRVAGAETAASHRTLWRNVAMHLKKLNLFPDHYPTEEFYPFHLSVLRRTKQIEFHTPVTLFVGENGTGKSTLLEAISNRCGIHIWREADRPRVEVNPFEEKLCNYIALGWARGSVPGSFFGSDVFRDFTYILDEWAAADPGQLEYFGGKSLVTQSHGQSLMSFFRARFQIKGLYLLDEPETALSPGSQLELLTLLMNMSRMGHAQFIISTHSPIIMACPGARIYSFDQIPLRQIKYEETEHYKIYKGFMNDRNTYLQQAEETRPQATR
jgi:predicted ATPase